MRKKSEKEEKMKISLATVCETHFARLIRRFVCLSTMQGRIKSLEILVEQIRKLNLS